MAMTLDEYLEELDRWKQPVSNQMQALDPAARSERDRDARAWLQAQLGHPLDAVPVKETKVLNPA